MEGVSRLGNISIEILGIEILGRCHLKAKAS